MRVKKLEILGFKSFAHKTTVHFEPGVTAVVGPNGSGKSNIVDAIRWVLGEHNPRDVRAPRLEDVIFNGTDQKAPLSLAEVSLTIDNEQGLLPISFTEVTITRRVYRSGESEYFINQSPCRLKDIQELFLGTGLGGGTYAIIEQGHIDMILSSKPEERRVVFEEASGVAKYLAKKQETVRRLDEVEEHLVRIADIIGEVRRQVGALERAANKARQYKTQWEALKQLELRLAVDELCAGQARDQALESQAQTLQAQRVTLERQKQDQMTLLETCNATLSTISQQLQESRARVLECVNQMDQHESQHALKSRWMEELQQQILGVEQEESQGRVRLAQLDEQLARTSGAETELQAQLTALQTELGHGQEEIAALEATIQAARHAIAEAKAQVFDAASSASHQRNELTEITSRLQGLEAQLARLDAQGTQRTATVDTLQHRRDQLVREREALQTQYDALQRRLSTTQQQLDVASVRRHEVSGRLHQFRDHVASERAQVQLLEGLWHRYEGFPETVKQLMSRSVEGLIGPLVDLVQAAPGAEALVEAALGPLAEAVVVQDRQALLRCRELLAAEQLESCRFLVLSDCPAAPTMEQPVSQAGVSGAVKQFVRTDPQYQPLVDWLLNDSWIIDDVQRLIGRHEAPQGRFVSQRGDRWDRRSWRFGETRLATSSPAGAANMAGGRLGRRARWEEALTQLRAREEELRQLDAEVQQAERDWHALLQEQESAKGELSHLAPTLHKLEASFKQIAHELERTEEAQRTTELEVQELSGQRDELNARLTAAQQAVEEAQRRQQAIEQALAQAQSARETADQTKAQLAIARAQREATQQALTERLESLHVRRAELESDRAQLLEHLEAKASQRLEAIRRFQELTGQLQDHETSSQRFQAERGVLEAEVTTIAKTLQDEEAKRNQVLPHLLAVEQQLSALMQQLQDETQQLSERTYRRSHLVERLRELYQIEEATIQAERTANPAALTAEQRATITGEVQKLRTKLEGMGPVSLGSVEEYDELKRRLEFLQTQQQDLIQARDDLKASIAQINRTARAQFRETFARITQEFQHYYSRLFDGGEANLMLLDEDDVLESGIDIVARPPGKRLQSISLLSGGERALTAVALLFALFKVRPSPFCILDEIDAPLDEPNVDRFTRVLEEFLSLSQFILITHNKKTITKADCLYGVTMEEPGISKILSAKLTKVEPAPQTVSAPA